MQEEIKNHSSVTLYELLENVFNKIKSDMDGPVNKIVEDIETFRKSEVSCSEIEIFDEVYNAALQIKSRINSLPFLKK